MENKIYDLCVIGGGPAGMMAAISAGKKGKSVLLLEKNEGLGKKLLISGKQRCNITNSERDINDFIKKYGRKGKFLYPAFNNFNNYDIEIFFNDNGLKTKNERGNRVFPASDNARDVLDTLIFILKSNKVTIRTKCEVKNILFEESSINKIEIDNGEKIVASNYLIATGGLSFPKTGSTGDGSNWAKKMGHTIIKTKPALVPMVSEEKWINKLRGLDLKNIRVDLYHKNKKILNRTGEVSFMLNGIGGPIILDISKKIIEHFNDKKKPEIFIDLKPALEFPALDKRIQRDFELFKNSSFKGSLNKLLPAQLIPVIIELSKIDPEKEVSNITKVERKGLCHLLKGLKITLIKPFGFDKAIITCGGIDLTEIDPNTMRSKIINNLFFAGEIIDIDGPTGGYNLQVCWSTGHLAGASQ